MKEEFTTVMHADMLGWSQEDANLIDAYSKIKSGNNKRQVCEKHGITVEYYDENIEAAKKRCFS